MCRILVSGLINIETTLQVEGFPIDYEPVRFPFFGIQSSVSGVGYNVAKALTVLGNDVRFLSLIGGDMAGSLVLESLAVDGISTERVITALRQTPQSVILYDRTGRRAINTDLKDIQDAAYPVDRFDEAIKGVRVWPRCVISTSRGRFWRVRKHWESRSPRMSIPLPTWTTRTTGISWPRPASSL